MTKFNGLPPAKTVQESITIALAQLALLRRLDQARNRRGNVVLGAIMAMLIVFVWLAVSFTIAAVLAHPYGIAVR